MLIFKSYLVQSRAVATCIVMKINYAYLKMETQTTIETLESVDLCTSDNENARHMPQTEADVQYIPERE
jgi:hypothetical protein